MAVTQRQRQYLQSMGIQTWLRRDMAPQPVSDEDFVADSQESPRMSADTVSSETAPETVATGVGARSSSEQPRGGDVHHYNWDQLKGAVKHCIACELHTTRKNTVFGVGNEQADWMVIGEAPGADEDRQGEPFVGRAGQLLNNMLLAIGLKREQVYIANILKCRPPNNRDPRPEEVIKCEPYLKRQVELVKPKIILAVGRIAAHNLLKTETSLSRLRGQCFYYGDNETPLVVTYHPAYLLRSPREKRKAWQDLLYAQSICQQQR
ncbi:MAG: uracil-DNA glycosylase [Gammaproteobacteria bacterium]|jgi:DNA polymerase